MLVGYFISSLIYIGLGLLVLLPWMVLWQAWIEYKKDELPEVASFSIIICAMVCIFEVLALIDYLMGSTLPWL